MKVFFPGPEPKTYHPELGKLIKGHVFELPEGDAKRYIAGGLLKELASQKPKAPTVSGPKNKEA